MQYSGASYHLKHHTFMSNMALVSLLFVLVSVGLSTAQVNPSSSGASGSPETLRSTSNEDVYSALVRK